MDEQYERTYGQFYALLKRLPGADKEELVWQFTQGRTRSLRQMTDGEYQTMLQRMKDVAGYDERREQQLKALKRARSACLHQMQLWGTDTADWGAVDRFCRNPRIAGKEFRRLDQVELEQLTRKLRAMIKKREQQQ